MTPTQEKILDVAQSLIVAGGYNGFSYADISAAIGIRKASIHHHFPTKAELVAVLVDRYRDEVAAGLAAIAAHASDPAGQLEAYVSYWQSCLTNASLPFCVCAMLASEMQVLPEDVAWRVSAHFQSLASWLAAVLTAGKAQQTLRLDTEPEAQAQILMASVHGALLSARALTTPALFSQILEPQLARLRPQ